MRLKLREGLLYWGLRLVRALDRRRRDTADLGTGRIRRILAISNTALGDTLMTTPGLRLLRSVYPDAHLTLLAHPFLTELFAGVEGVDSVVAYSGKWRGFVRAWRALRTQARAVAGGSAGGYDLAVIFHGNEPQATPLAYLSGARFVFKLPNTNRFRFLLANPQPPLGWDDLGHGIDQRVAVARLACGQAAGLPPPPLGDDDALVATRRMTVPDRSGGAAVMAAALAERGWETRPLVALQPGASTASRRWPRRRFIDAARALAAAYPDLRFVVTGSPAEASLCREVADGINAGAVTGVPLAWASAGELPLTALPALFTRSRVLVTGDTGPMHLAVAVGTPVVALFAVSDPNRSGPAYDLERHVIIRKWRTCSPCLSKRCPYAEPICMDNIAVDEVVAAVAAILNRPSVSVPHA